MRGTEQPKAGDDTERKQAEEALRQAISRYEQQVRLFEGVASTTPDFVYVFDLHGRFLYANRRLLEVWGMTLQDATGKTCRELGYEQWHHDMHMREIAHVIQTKSQIKGEVPFRAPLTGHFGIYEYIFTPVLAPDGEVEFIAGTTRDITDRKRAEQAVQDSEARLRLAVETAELGTYERNLVTNEMVLNRACQRILGVSGEPIPLDVARRSAHPDDKERVFTAVARAFDPELREICAAEFRILRLDGTVRWVAGRGRVVFDDSQKPPLAVKFMGVLNDITERKLAEEKLVRAKEELSRLNAELERRVADRTAKLQETVAELEYFSYTITHDMRAPLRAMRGYGNMLLDELSEGLDPTQRDLIRRISEAALRMDHLITDSLDYSRVVRLQPALQPLDPAALVRGIVESYPHFQLPKAEILIEPDIPCVLGNEAGLVQCFSNLLGNAVKFVAPGTIPKVVVSAERRGDFVRLWVKDNGIGIRLEYQDKIWQMFQRLSNRYEGTGIGLALVHKVVERMRGRAGVESEPGQGSRFWVELQAADGIIEPA